MDRQGHKIKKAQVPKGFKYQKDTHARRAQMAKWYKYQKGTKFYLKNPMSTRFKKGTRAKRTKVSKCQSISKFIKGLVGIPEKALFPPNSTQK